MTFRHPLDNKPVEITLPEGDKRTEAVVHFHNRMLRVIAYIHELRFRGGEQ